MSFGRFCRTYSVLTYCCRMATPLAKEVWVRLLLLGTERGGGCLGCAEYLSLLLTGFYFCKQLLIGAGFVDHASLLTPYSPGIFVFRFTALVLLMEYVFRGGCVLAAS